MKDIQVHKLGAYPIVKSYMDKLGVHILFSNVFPSKQEAANEADCLCVLIANIILSVKPLYKISEWLKPYVDGQTEYGYEAKAFNDDKLGRSLDRLYGADRNSLMSALSSKAIEIYELKTEVVHNDTTSISFSGGGYKNEADKDTVNITQGFNKDGRPDAKQIVFGLNILGDGHVPILAHIYDGNKTDSETHIPNWEALKELLQKTDFIYIADSKLATIENMGHIAKHEGEFISILPATRGEVQAFHSDLISNKKQPTWTRVMTKVDTRTKNKQIVYKAYSDEQTKEGYALHWIHSSAKAEQDAERRQKNLLKIQESLKELAPKLNKYHLKTKEQIQAKIDGIAGKNACLFNIQINEHQKIKQTKIGRGRIGKNTQFKEQTIISYSINWSLNELQVQQQSKKDGIFPLVTNTDLTAKKVLEHYKNQPFLEKKFYTLKSVLEVVPTFLHLPHRIEAMLFLYFIALMIIALMEREAKQNMVIEKIDKLPILPQKMKTSKPTWNNIRYFFEPLFFLAQEKDKQGIETLVKGLSPLHQTLLKLLKVPLNSYQINNGSWWKFNST